MKKLAFLSLLLAIFVAPFSASAATIFVQQDDGDTGIDIAGRSVSRYLSYASSTGTGIPDIAAMRVASTSVFATVRLYTSDSAGDNRNQTLLLGCHSQDNPGENSLFSHNFTDEEVNSASVSGGAVLSFQMWRTGDTGTLTSVCGANSTYHVGFYDMGNEAYTYGDTSSTFQTFVGTPITGGKPFFGFFSDEIYPDIPDFDPSTFYQSMGIINIENPEEFGTTSNPVIVDFNAFISASSSPSLRPDGYQLVFFDKLSGVSSVSYGLLPSYIPGTAFSVSTTSASFVEGSYILNVGLVTGVAQFIENDQQSPGHVGTERQITFAIDHSTSFPLGTIGYEGPTADSSTCSVNFLGDFDLSGCMTYLISPASTTLQDFSQLTLRNSFPFAYAYDIGTMRDELFSSDANGTTTIAVTVPGFGTITFLSRAMIAAVPFAATIKTILAALMWLLLAEVIYYTVLRSHNKETGV